MARMLYTDWPGEGSRTANPMTSMKLGGTGKIRWRRGRYAAADLQLILGRLVLRAYHGIGHGPPVG